MEIKLFEYIVVKPFAIFGLTHSFFDLNLDTLIMTWAGMIALFAFAFFARYQVNKNPDSLVGVSLELAVKFFADLCEESIGQFDYRHFSFISSICFFTLFCNMVSLLPFIEEAAKDVNTAFAIALCSFIYVQYQEIHTIGFIGYIKSYFEPMFFMFPLEIIGKISSIVSMAFRLFGNILGGSIIFTIFVNGIGLQKEIFMIASFSILILYAIASYYLNLNKHKIIQSMFFLAFSIVFFLAGMQLFFGVFEAVIQSFVLTMLSLTYLAIAITPEEVPE